MNELCNRITTMPGLCGGEPTVRGKRIAVYMILKHLSAGDSFADILNEFPFLQEGGLYACLAYTGDKK